MTIKNILLEKQYECPHYANDNDNIKGLNRQNKPSLRVKHEMTVCLVDLDWNNDIRHYENIHKI